jgi:integrase
MKSADSKGTQNGVRLFKRGDNAKETQATAPGWRDRPYYFKFNFRGTRYMRCLDTNNVELAQKLAKALIKEITEAVIREEVDRLNATKQRRAQPAIVATVAQLLKAYLAAPGNAGPKTRKQNVNALRRILMIAHPDTEPDPLPVSEISKSLACLWFKTAKVSIDTEPDQRVQGSLKTSANSRFKQAASLFTAPARECYKQLGIDNECFGEFDAAFKVFRFQQSKQAQAYDPPSEQVVEETLRDWMATSDRNLFLAIGHELAFGLRAGELSQAKWSWWTSRNGYPVVDDSANVKNGSGQIAVRALDPFFSQMAARVDKEGWRGAPGDFILTGTKTNRTDKVFRGVSAFMRAHRWATTKTNHALRAYSGSQIIMRYGPYEAQCWLRHSGVDITQKFYSYFVNPFRLADVATMAARWATLIPQTPMLRILEASSAATTPAAPSSGQVPVLRMAGEQVDAK